MSKYWSALPSTFCDAALFKHATDYICRFNLSSFLGLFFILLINFRCRADYKESPSKHSNLNLTVIGKTNVPKCISLKINRILFNRKNMSLACLHSFGPDITSCGLETTRSIGGFENHGNFDHSLDISGLCLAFEYARYLVDFWYKKNHVDMPKICTID